MTDHATFESLRAGLLTATTRDLARRRRRRNLALATLVTLASIYVATGIAVAASARIARAIADVPGSSIFDVFHGDASPERPIGTTQDMLDETDQLQRGVDGRARMIRGTQRVLLHRRIDGVDVVIAAVKQEHGEASTGRDAVCYAVSTSDPTFGGGGVTCSPEMIPGTHVNYAASNEIMRDRTVRVVLAGVTDDEVRAIDVHTSAGTERVAMGDHAFYWRSSDDALPAYLTIHLHDGSSVETSFGMDYGRMRKVLKLGGSRDEAARAVTQQARPGVRR